MVEVAIDGVVDGDGEDGFSTPIYFELLSPVNGTDILRAQVCQPSVRQKGTVGRRGLDMDDSPVICPTLWTRPILLGWSYVGIGGEVEVDTCEDRASEVVDGR